MPASVTHAYFALDIYNKLDSSKQNILKNYIENLKTYSAGPDVFFFYKSLFPKKRKSIQNIQKIMQKTNTKDFFINTIKYIKDNELEYNGEVLSFLYGYISHYILDSTVHPFVIYKAGVFNKKKSKTFKYNALHTDIETYIDAYIMYTRNKILPKNFKPHNFSFNIKYISNDLQNLIDFTTLETYNIKNINNIYLKAIKDMQKHMRKDKYDPYGIKMFFYKLHDFIHSKRHLKKASLSYYLKPKDKLYYLNPNKEEWNHPLDKNEIYNYSFIELYVIALDKAMKTINKVNDYLFEDKNIKIIKNAFENVSYITGKNCDDKRPLKYFEF